MYLNNLKLLFPAFALVCLSNASLASGISRDVRESAGIEQTEQNGGYFELGVGISSQNKIIFKGNEDENKTGLGARINLGYQWNGLFVDLNDDDGFSFGYNAINTEHWSYDLIGGRLLGIDKDNSDDFEVLRKRESAATFGVRATGFYDNHIFQFEVRQAQHDDFDGTQASILAGTSWQYRNLNTHLIAGIHYSSSGINDYYWGVNSEEATSEFAEYQLDDSVSFSTELGMTYPLSESWIVKGKLNYAYGSEEFANSPLRADDSQHFVSASAAIIYVF